MKTKTQGLVLIEMLIYIVISVVLIAITTYFILSAYHLYSDTTVRSQADRVGASIMNQIVRETREGVAIASASSTFNTPSGAVTITTEGADVEFFLSNGRLMWEEGASSLALNPDTHTVTHFYLTQLTTPVSTGVRYEIGITYQTRAGSETRYYTGFSILRQSYE
ncbi:MAG TPA: hypothetical protein VGE31_03550 [Candidatus Paceibacterota bacterium]